MQLVELGDHGGQVKLLEPALFTPFCLTTSTATHSAA
jgi:hypothetical protein